MAALTLVGSGGVLVAGAAPASATGTGARSTMMMGGASLGGSAVVMANAAQLGASLPVLGCSIYALGNRVGVLGARLPLPTATLKGGAYRITALLPKVSSSITASAGVSGVIGARLKKVTSNLTDTRTVKAGLPLVAAALSGRAGVVGTVAARLTLEGSAVAAGYGGIGQIGARLPVLGAALSVRTGLICVINAGLPASTAVLRAYAGSAGAIVARLGLMGAALNAGFGARGTVTARLPALNAALAVQARALTQQLVMVVNTQTAAVSTYENFAFNAFFELAGAYYATGPGGLYRVDVGGSDAGTAIAAGIGTGLMDFGDAHQKRIFDSFLTLRTTGTLTLSATTDEAQRQPAATVSLLPYGATGLVQRHLPLPGGLRGKSWQFELANVAGADFDFAQLDLSLSVSRRHV
jgi:hypothetical protein